MLHVNALFHKHKKIKTISATAQRNEEIPKTTDLLGKLLVGAIMSNPDTSHEIRSGLGKLRDLLGKDAKTFFQDMEQAQVATISGCIDMAVLGKITDPTLGLLKGLPEEQEMLANMVIMGATGRGRNGARWCDFLWNIRKKIDLFVTHSLTRMRREDVAKALNEVAYCALKASRGKLLEMLD